MKAKRTVRKSIETSMAFDSDDLKILLLKAAGAPEKMAEVAVLKDQNGDTFYGDITVVWRTSEEQEFDE